ncbi:hypothetical protein Y032_0843g2640 [Ancylostoma ceylanicum]|uniref:Uncharacterized protein n=1 Tax=Ancylostoma ceylanicum TaxID=53326 RepID=A0A016WD27_9BILA|nr:hypothetical protein Y032_0843g2640 [Ancylostoma ceylanicum]
MPRRKQAECFEGRWWRKMERGSLGRRTNSVEAWRCPNFKLWKTEKDSHLLGGDAKERTIGCSCIVLAIQDADEGDLFRYHEEIIIGHLSYDEAVEARLNIDPDERICIAVFSTQFPRIPDFEMNFQMAYIMACVKCMRF